MSREESRTSPPPLPRTRLTGAFERRVARALAGHVAQDAPLVVACSGGPDSLATLVAVARTHPGRVTAAHFDHRLRDTDEVAGERDLVERVADLVGAAFSSGRAARTPGARDEATARAARYRWLARACMAAGAAACATGHTQDDQAETVLLRIVRGTGVGGAAGMAAAAGWPVPVRGVPPPRLLRPLLTIGRAEVEAYLDALGLAAAIDPSNATLDYARNRVRLQVIPELRALNPQATRQIAAFAAQARSDDEALSAWAGSAFEAIGDRDAAGRSVALDRATLLALPVAVATRVIRIAAAQLGLSIDRAEAEAALHAARAGGRRAALGGTFIASRRGGALVIAAADAR